MFTFPSTFRKSAAAGAYSGPGNITTFVAWWGLRAYSAAAIGGSAVDVYGSTTATTFTFVTKAGGGLELSAGGAAAFLSGNTGAGNMLVQKLYDQTGNGHHITITGAASPIFAPSVLGSFPVVRFTTGTGKKLQTASGISQSQPWTTSSVINITSAGAVANLMSDSTNYGFYLTSTPTLRVNVSTHVDSATMSTGTWYPVLGVFNGASSVNRVVNTEVTGTVSSTSMTGSHTLSVGSDDFGQDYHGDMMEIGFTATAESSGNRASLISNQQAFWGI
jgi:hypothetical protein